MPETLFQAELEALVGRPMGEAGRRPGPDPVNVPMIRHWLAAFEDGNPRYLDRGESPPVMLQTWTFPTPVITGMAERGGAPTEIKGDSPLKLFDDAGFTGTLAVGSEFEIERYARLGETVWSESVLESISEEKQTRLGPGHFVQWGTTYTNDEGEVLGRQHFRILKFKP